VSDFYNAALQKLGIRQKAYQTAFGREGSAGFHVLVDLADYAHAFAADPENLTERQLWEMHGRRQMFFRIFKHIKLTPQELENVARSALQHAAMRLASKGADQ
jgi:hypothetical protein